MIQEIELWDDCVYWGYEDPDAEIGHSKWLKTDAQLESEYKASFPWLA